jgi:3D (Asp-Asp-Asp) domain-containing protein
MRTIAVAVVLLISAATATAQRRAGGRAAPALHVEATAYCDRGMTKSGVPTRRGIVAADPDHLPLGTRLRIVAPGEAHDGVYVVTDTGAAVKGREIDIFMPSCARAEAFGRKRVLIRILKRGRGAADARATVGTTGTRPR